MTALPTRALTLWQPYAWLVATGEKPLENRPRGFAQKSFRGEFWIHAGKHEPDDDDWDRVLTMCREATGTDDLGERAMNAWSSGNLALGAIIGRGTIAGIVPPRPRGSMWDAYLARDAPLAWHIPSQYAFVVEGASLLSEPVPCEGSRGFWLVSPETRKALTQALKRKPKPKTQRKEPA